MRRSRLIASGAVALVLGTAFLSSSNSNEEKAKKDCPDGFEHVAGTGCARPKGKGMMEVHLKDGSRVTTHGGDPAEAFDDQGHGPKRSTQTSDAPHECVTTTEAHHQVIYAYPSDKTNRFSTISSVLQNAVNKLQYEINDEATRMGSSAKLKFICTSGAEKINVVKTAITTADTTFSNLLSDLKAKGYNSTLGKYLIYSDVPSSGSSACGQGTLTTDDRPVEDNANNIGPEFAVMWDCSTPLTHEWGHTHGAVQPGSPHFYQNSGGRHCYDERDIMCYGNSPDDPTIQQLCTDRTWFDCNHDDYFNTSPASGSYLSNHWNIGFCVNKWVIYSVCAAIPPPPTTTTTTTILLPPGTPTNFDTGRNVQDRTVVTLDWTSPASGGTPGGYRVYNCFAKSLGLECEPTTVVGTATATGYTATGLNKFYTYCWAVTAYNTSGESAKTAKRCSI